MSDELQDHTPEFDTANQVIESNVISPTPKGSNKKLWIFAGIVVAVICICSVLCLVLLGTSFGKVMVEKAPVEAVLDDFMVKMTAKDIESAYELFSPRVQRQISLENVQEMADGNNYVLFEGYQDLSVTNLNIGPAVNTNPDMPQGTVANVSGEISYSGGFVGHFEAILEKVERNWRLHYINVTVPPDKIQP